jgi:aquaporin Z
MKTPAMTTSFIVSALPVEHFEPLFALSDEALAAHGVRRIVAGEDGRYPCRVTLEDIAPGQSLLLVNYEHQPAATPYRSNYAIFVSEAARETRRMAPDALPAVLRGRPIALRAYDAAGMLLGAQLALEDNVAEKARDLLGDPAAAYLHAHNAGYGLSPGDATALGVRIDPCPLPGAIMSAATFRPDRPQPLGCVMAKKMFAEFIGTLTLVLIGCGAVVLAGEHVGQLGIALAFGFAIVAMAYGIGPISGCHVNPAVSLAVFVAGRMPLTELLAYWVAQFVGALVGAAILMVIAGGVASGLGHNGWGPGYNGGYSLLEAAVFEVVMTALFTLVILGSTSPNAQIPFAGLAIGITLAMIHIVGIQVTGVSVNPARSFGPAVLVGGQALGQLWLFFVAPAIGAIISGLIFRARLLSAEPALAPADQVANPREVDLQRA